MSTSKWLYTPAERVVLSDALLPLAEATFPDDKAGTDIVMNTLQEHSEETTAIGEKYGRVMMYEKYKELWLKVQRQRKTMLK